MPEREMWRVRSGLGGLRQKKGRTGPLQNQGEAAAFASASSVGRTRLQRAGVCCGLRELQAQFGASLRRFGFDSVVRGGAVPG